MTQRSTQPQRSRGTRDIWLDPKAAPADRLLAFHRWLAWRIAQLFRLEQDQERLVAQLRELVLNAVRQLNERGYLLDGQPLADLLEGKLRTVADQHRTGAVRDLYAYFKKSWDSFIALRAEELRFESKALGMHIDNFTAEYSPTIPQLETTRHTESLRDQLARKRRRDARKTADQAQQTLFGS